MISRRCKSCFHDWDLRSKSLLKLTCAIFVIKKRSEGSSKVVDSGLDNHVTRQKGGSRKIEEKTRNGASVDVPNDGNVKHNAGDAAEVSDYQNASRFHELNEKPEKDGTKYVDSRPNRFRSFSDAAGRGPSFDKWEGSRNS